MEPTTPTHAQMYQARLQPGADQSQLAPLEHRAFAREWVQENPLVAVPSLAAAIPLYSGLKALGLTKTRSPASFREMTQGYAGIVDGLRLLSR